MPLEFQTFVFGFAQLWAVPTTPAILELVLKVPFEGN